MDWSTFLASVASSAVLASVISSVLDARSTRVLAREDRHTTSIDNARDSLAILRTAYQQAGKDNGSGAKSGVVLLGDGDEDGRDDLLALENAFDAAIGKCDNEVIRLAAQAYKEVGRGYAAGDPDQGIGREQEKYQALQSAMNARSRRFRAK